MTDGKSDESQILNFRLLMKHGADLQAVNNDGAASTNAEAKHRQAAI
jgi:hypothetical protein